MLKQTLYDKEITLTLYKAASVETYPMRIHATTGYGETTVGGKKVLYSNGTIDGEKSGSYTVVANIEFYEGYTRREVSSVVNGKEIIRTHMATGPLYTFNTMEEMKRGIHPDGSLMKTGDRIYVVENRSRWNAVVSGSPSNLLSVQSVSREIKAERITIKSNNSGLKPDISLSVNLLPGQNCYKAVVRVKNLNIDAADIRYWNRMVIEAGYRIGGKVTFNCPIFSSYIESPNPDGVTVFEGITVGQIESQMFSNPVEIHFNEESVRIGDLIEQCASGIGKGIIIANSLAPELNSIVLSVSKQVVYAENGLAVLNWIQNTVSQVIQEQTNGRTSILVQLIDDVLSIIALNGPNVISKLQDKAIDLNMVSGATFNGTALTVEAPWNPLLKPGNLFYMPPEFINGSKLPNVLPVSDYKNVDNLYRVLTMSIAFSTVENNNRMSILAVPAQFAQQLTINKTTEMTPDKYAALKNAAFNLEEKRTQVVQVGTASGMDKAALTLQEQKTSLDMFDKGRATVMSLSNTAITVDPLTMGNCLSQIAQYYCVEWGNGPRLPRGMGDGHVSTFYKAKISLSGEKAKSHYQSGGIPCWALWWPLIAVGTYWRKQEDIAAGVGNNWDTINLDNPDLIHEGKALWIPTFQSYSALTRVKDVYRDAYLDYKDKYPSWALWWRAAYYYFGGTDDIG